MNGRATILWKLCDVVPSSQVLDATWIGGEYFNVEKWT